MTNKGTNHGSYWTRCIEQLLSKYAFDSSMYLADVSTSGDLPWGKHLMWISLQGIVVFR